jgi:SH3 domain-containing protein
MKGVLFLGLVGAAIYGAILLSYDLLPHDPAANVFTGQSLGNPDDRQLRSWGTDLPALASSNSQEASLALRKAATTPVSPSPVAASTDSPSDGKAYQSVEWAKVAFAAKVHSEASVSSPTLRFYRPGTALQVVDRQNGWVQVNDPTSRERGWVFEQYLVPADGPTATQTAMATASTKVAAEPARANPMPSAKRRVRAPRPAARMPHDFASAQFDRRWDRRAERPGGFGLFFFRRFARAE